MQAQIFDTNRDIRFALFILNAENVVKTKTNKIVKSSLLK